MIENTRRSLVLGAAGACAAFGLDRPIAFIDFAYAQHPIVQPFRKYKVGDIEVFTLIDGAREFPLREGMIRNATVEQIKAALRAVGLPESHSQIMFTAWAVKLGDQLALIDSGTGGHPIYGQGNGKLLQSMAAAGLDPKAVKTILLTHLHGDHIYGLMNHETNAQVFPDAEIVVPNAELKFWTRPGVEVAGFRTDAQRPRPAHSGHSCDLEERQAVRRGAGASAPACTPFGHPVIAPGTSRI